MFTSDKEDKELISRADDAVRLSSLRHSPVFLGFLNEREQYILKDYLTWYSGELDFWGGYKNSTRNIASILLKLYALSTENQTSSATEIF